MLYISLLFSDNIIKLKHIAKMNKLINYLNDINMDDRTERIIEGELQPTSIQDKVRQFNALPVEKRYAYMNRLTERMAKIRQPHQLLSVLLLLDHIHQYNPRLPMPQALVEGLQCGVGKESVILINIISYYHYFLKCNISNRFNIETINPEDEFTEAENFSHISIQKIMELLKISFVFQHGIVQIKQHKLLIKSILKSILIRVREDLKIVNLFIRNNIQIVLQRTVRHPLVSSIYKVYQKLIFINKSLQRLQNLNALLQTNLQFPRYEMNVELNRQLQFAMQERKEINEREMERNLCRSEKQLMYDCYIEEQRSIHTTESFLLLDEANSLL